MMNLPARFVTDESGAEVKRPLAKHRSTWDYMQRGLAACEDAMRRREWAAWMAVPEELRAGLTEPQPLSVDDRWNDHQLHHFAAWCLALNYRGNRWIFEQIGEDGLFTDENLFGAVAYATDIDRIQALQADVKKKESQWRSLATAGGAAA